ncbi:MAG: crossover junction endodeoxyribonuclease RuvC [bacterium]
MRILGIDPGTATTGWGIVDQDKKSDNGLKMVAYGAITTKAKQPNSQRLAIISNELEEIIKKYSPDVSSVEKLFFTNNQKTAMSVGEARGVILLSLENHSIPIYEFTPPQIKSGVCGYGRADKKQVQAMVQAILQMEEKPKPDDAADGLAAAICGASSVDRDDIISKQ